MTNWSMDLDNRIYTAVKVLLLKDFQQKYLDFYVTNSSVTPDVARFPTVYIHPLQGSEAGATMEGGTVDGVSYGLQIEVTTKAGDVTAAREIMSEAMGIMKGMLFRGVGLPLCEDGGDTYRLVARFQRTIGDGDSLNFG